MASIIQLEKVEMALESVQDSIKTCCRTTTYTAPEDLAKEIEKIKASKSGRTLSISQAGYR